ncbi:MAG: DNA gyrase inhibitor YacG [Rhodospirillales bacterium]|nr:DNA gyrase inhibitor YacG [Rhodospirillales bacterium]
MADPHRCPICAHLPDPASRPPLPFCSRRCAQIDLGRWLNEEYRIPATEDDPEDDPPA